MTHLASRSTQRSIDDEEIARVSAIMKDTAAMFVFGSNRAGVHGAGAALAAVRLYGAIPAIGEGRAGRSYAIPTKDRDIRTLSLSEIAVHVDTFIDYARIQRTTTFAVTRIGCGLAGYSDAEIAPLFAKAPSNCRLPTIWSLV